MIVLSAITLCSVIVVALLSVTRTDRMASRAAAINERTGFLAEAGVEHALALLDNNIPQPVPPGKTAVATNWLVNPGLLTLVTGSPGAVKLVPLSSNPSATYAAQASDANLNATLSTKLKDGSPTFPIYPDGTPLRVAWVNVLKNPAQAASKANPIVGRYAFWIDDESAKVNVNFSYGKPNSLILSQLNPLQKLGTTFDGTASGNIADYAIALPTKDHQSGSSNITGYPLWHTEAINLDVIDSKLDRDSLVDWIHNKNSDKCNWRFLESPAEIKRFYTASSADAAFEKIKFDVTAKSRSPEFNVFGKSRLFLHSRIPVWREPQFFQFTYDGDGPMYFHGSETRGVNNTYVYPNINGMQMVADHLSDLLARTDWPGMPATSFAQKWDDGKGTDAGLREADQVAWNIVAWGNYAADRNGDMAPSPWPEGGESLHRWFQNWAPAGHPASVSSRPYNERAFRGKLSKKAILPWYPRPYVNEIAMKVTREDVAGVNYRVKIALAFEFVQEALMPTYITYGGTYVDANMGVLRFKQTSKSTWVYPTRFEYTVSDGTKTISQQVKYTDTTNGVTGSGSEMKTLWTGMPSAEAAYTLTSGSPVISESRELYVPDIFKNAGYQKVIFPVLTNHSVTNGNPNYQPNGLAFLYAYVFTKSKLTFSNIKLRFAVLGDTNTSGSVIELIPVWDAGDTTAFDPPKGQAAYVKIPDFTVDFSQLSGGSAYRSIEVVDPRLGGRSVADAGGIPIDSPEAWTAHAPADPTSGGFLSGNSLGTTNDVAKANTYSHDKFAFFDYQQCYWGAVHSRPSIGMLSVVPIGMQRGLRGETLKFQPSKDATTLPDWLLLDLICPTLTPNTYMNSAAGKINLNARIYPTAAGSWSGDSLQRWRPLQALFQNLGANATVASSATAPSAVVRNILNHQLASNGVDFGAQGKYDYIGEICEIAGVADSGGTNWDNEALIRNMANLLTTQSNVYTVWVLAQSVTKGKTATTNFGEFDSSTDVITGETSQHALVERYVWPGVDGVPGNGSVDTSGNYNRTVGPKGASYQYDTKMNILAGVETLHYLPETIGETPWQAPPTPRWAQTSKDNTSVPGLSWAEIDGPDAPTYPNVSRFGNRSNPGGLWGSESNSNYHASDLEKANNPLRAWMRYRVINLKNNNE